MKNYDEKPNLYELRLSKGWTQQQVANEIGIARSYYGMMETCGRTPSIKVAHKIANVFNINWQSFFE